MIHTDTNAEDAVDDALKENYFCSSDDLEHSSAVMFGATSSSSAIRCCGADG